MKVIAPAGIRVWGIVFGLLGAILFTVGSVLLYYQLVFSVAALSPLYHGADVDLERAAAAVPPWIVRAMVDLSLVTPGLLVHMAGCLLWGGIILVGGRFAKRHCIPTFPFPNRYRLYYVNMGLFGTLVGFVIAFWNTDMEARRQASVLVTSLSTAVWSSLVAVGLAYLVCPVLEIIWQFPVRSMLPRSGNPLDVLSASAASTASALDDVTRALAAMNPSLDLHMIASDNAVLKVKVESLNQRMKQIEENVRTLSTRSDETKADLREGFRTVNQKIDETRELLRDFIRSTEFYREMTVLRGDFAPKSDLNGLNDRLQAVESAVTKRNGQLRRIGKMLERAQDMLGKDGNGV